MYFHRVSSRHWPSPLTHKDAAWITTQDLYDHLVATYIQTYEKLDFSVIDLNVSGVARIDGSNILDLIDDARSDPYVLPNDISLSNLTAEKLTGIGFPEYIYVQGSIYPDGNLH